MKKTSAAIAAAFLLTLTGCASNGLKTDGTTPATDITVATEPAQEETPATPTATDDGLFGLQETATYESGITVSLAKFTRSVSSEWAAPGSKPFVKFTVKVTNGSKTKLDMSIMNINCQYGEEGQEAESVFDSARGLMGTPTTHLLPGRTASFPYGCAMPKTENYLQVEIMPDFESETSIFAGKVQ